MPQIVPKRQRAVNGRSPSAEAFSALVVQVLRLATALEVAGDTLANPVGQTSARWLVLAAVEDGPATVAVIARRLSHTRQSVQRIANALVRDGLVREAPNPAHRRANLVQLTPDGLRVLRSIQDAQATWAEQTASGLEPDHLNDLRESLAAIQRRLAESKQ